MPDTLLITLPQLRSALRQLEANVSAEALWEAISGQPVTLPAPWPSPFQSTITPEAHSAEDLAALRGLL